MTSSKFGHIFPSWQSPLRFERYNTVLQDVAGKAHPKNINQQTFTPDVQIWSLPPKDWLGVQALLGIFVIWDPKPPRPNPMSSDLGTKPRTKRAGSPAPHEVRWNAPWPVLPEHHRSWAITPAGQAQGAKSCVKGIWRAFQKKRHELNEGMVVLSWKKLTRLYFPRLIFWWISYNHIFISCSCAEVRMKKVKMNQIDWSSWTKTGGGGPVPWRFRCALEVSGVPLDSQLDCLHFWNQHWLLCCLTLSIS